MEDQTRPFLNADKGWRPIPDGEYGFIPHCEGTNCKKPLEYCMVKPETGDILCAICRQRKLEGLIAREMGLAS